MILTVDASQADCWSFVPAFYEDDLIGYVTSGGYGWRIDIGLAVGWIDSAYSKPGTRLYVQILEEYRVAEMLDDPAYYAGYEKLRN